MIDAQTWLVAVAACVVIVAVWAWGIVREDAAVVRAHASGIEAGRALERQRAADTTTGDPATVIPRNGEICRVEAPSAPKIEYGDDRTRAPLAVPEFLRRNNDAERGA